ncbi:catalase family protein [Acinetobacter junii]|uniref:catalase family protein n=1 Tax=Acinetobacter junii TaxID=40215 RepID=UPI0024498171|nr:catalase family protein [Acinetobacter junii]MDH1916515.1 catalase family protein [Acinetobacter junii]
MNIIKNTCGNALFILVTSSTLFSIGCSSAPIKLNDVDTPNSPKKTNFSYPTPDHFLGEKLQDNEEKLAYEISQHIEETIRKQYATKLALRDAHPKAHGCVKAEFKVLPNLAEKFAHGIFIPNKNYDAWIRFSNASSDASKADYEKDARGMAIKILGVKGNKILENEKNATTQDFIMINHPVFFADNASRYLKFVDATSSDSILKKLKLPFTLGFKGTKNAFSAANSKITNPINSRYWSMVPYQLGSGADRKAVKYSVKPCTQTSEFITKQTNPDYLRTALRSTLQDKNVCMEFMVQPRTSYNMSVEDSMTEWKESIAPFYTVAIINIPKQEFDTPEQNQFCENLSFTPWHSLPEHKPLGAINRMRKIIYENISTVRHQMNVTQIIGP